MYLLILTAAALVSVLPPDPTANSNNEKRTWTETFRGFAGFGNSEEGGCMDAQRDAEMKAMTACAARRGLKKDENFDECHCKSNDLLDTKVFTCEVRLKVECEER